MKYYEYNEFKINERNIDVNILILAGGLSPEREVSLSSASKIAGALIKKGNKVFIMDLCIGINSVKELCFTDNNNDIANYYVSENAPDIDFLKKNSNHIGKNVIESCKKADVVFLALHGDVGENGKVQALLDINAIKYTGSGYDGCLLSMNKNLSKMLAAANNIKTAKWSVSKKADFVNFPCVVKPVSGGSSIGISIADNCNELDLAMKAAREYDKDILIEEKLEGREFSVGILNDKPLPVIEIIPKNNSFYDYKNKYQPGLTKETCPADISNSVAVQLQRTAIKIHKLLNLRFYSRIDFIVDKDDNIYFLEANALPGMTAASLLPQEAAAVGISYEDLCCMIAESVFF